MFKLAKLFQVVLLLFFSAFPVVSFAEEIVGQVATKVIGITVSSNTPALRDLAARAFGLHGAFEMVRGAPATFDFAFNEAGDQAVRLEIRSQGALRATETVKGTSTENALLRAADLAVAKTTGKPGFFSGKLAFVSRRSGHREIYTANGVFRDLSQLTKESSNAIQPSWSRDGTKLLYTGYHRSGFPDIFVVDFTQNKRDLFASYRGTNRDGAFSPDGRQVAMILSNSGNSELYIGRADKSAAPRRLTRTEAVESDPSWSPDGNFIVFTSDRLGGPQLFRIATAGGSMSRIPTNISGYCTEPEWNPRDSDFIVFTASSAGRMQLAIFSFSTGKSVFLTDHSEDCAEPAWLNDGRHVVYTRKDATKAALWVIDTESGREARLSPASFGDANSPTFVNP